MTISWLNDNFNRLQTLGSATRAPLPETWCWSTFIQSSLRTFTSPSKRSMPRSSSDPPRRTLSSRPRSSWPWTWPRWAHTYMQKKLKKMERFSVRKILRACLKKKYNPFAIHKNRSYSTDSHRFLWPSKKDDFTIWFFPSIRNSSGSSSSRLWRLSRSLRATRSRTGETTLMPTSTHHSSPRWSQFKIWNLNLISVFNAQKTPNIF